MKIAIFAHFKEYHVNHKNFKSLYGFAGRCIKIRDACMDFEPCFKVHNLVSVHPKSTILGQMTNLNMIFHVVVSVYWLVKTWNSPQFPAAFRKGQLVKNFYFPFPVFLSLLGVAEREHPPPPPPPPPHFVLQCCFGLDQRLSNLHYSYSAGNNFSLFTGRMSFQIFLLVGHFTNWARHKTLTDNAL